jgi:ribonucleotide monophosphatase NagD (HAD superfamily)
MDVIEGQELKINTIAVLTGFLSEKILEGYSPDKIVSTILSIKPSELLEKI